MDQLIDKIAFLLMPENFAKILPYCIWYWIVLTAILFWIYRKR